MLTDKIFSPVDEAIAVPQAVSTAVLRRGDRLQVRLEGIA